MAVLEAVRRALADVLVDVLLDAGIIALEAAAADAQADAAADALQAVIAAAEHAELRPVLAVVLMGAKAGVVPVAPQDALEVAKADAKDAAVVVDLDALVAAMVDVMGAGRCAQIVVTDAQDALHALGVLDAAVGAVDVLHVLGALDVAAVHHVLAAAMDAADARHAPADVAVDAQVVAAIVQADALDVQDALVVVLGARMDVRLRAHHVQAHAVDQVCKLLIFKELFMDIESVNTYFNNLSPIVQAKLIVALSAKDFNAITNVIDTYNIDKTQLMYFIIDRNNVYDWDYNTIAQCIEYTLPDDEPHTKNVKRAISLLRAGAITIDTYEDMVTNDIDFAESLITRMDAYKMLLPKYINNKDIAKLQDIINKIAQLEQETGVQAV